VGAAFIVLEVYVFGRWILGGHVHTIGSGPTPVPGLMKAFALGQQIVLPIGALLVIYFVYESVLVALTWTMWAIVHHYRDDAGRTVVERGVDQLAVREWQRTALRVLAATGVVNLIFLAGYQIPVQVLNAHGARWPADTQARSYFTSGMCGPGTQYACAPRQPPVQAP
jgi:hypothetical protein